jgi:hypothetical protein
MEESRRLMREKRFARLSGASEKTMMVAILGSSGDVFLRRGTAMQSWKLFAGFVIAVTIVAAPAAKADDATTAPYVANCSANPHSCQESVGMGIVLGEYGACAPDSMLQASDAQVLQVMDWLKAHPDVHPDDWTEAVGAAIDDIYPCPN